MRKEGAIAALVEPVLEELQGLLLAGTDQRAGDTAGDKAGDTGDNGQNGRGLAGMIAQAIDEARFLQEDAVLDALEEVDRFLRDAGAFSGEPPGVTIPAEELLPKIFALQETIQSVEVHLPRRSEADSSGTASLIDWDAQLDLHEVSRLDEQARFLLDGALSRGQDPYLVRMVLTDTDLVPSGVVQVLEDHFSVLKGVVTEARARVTALVVHAGEPPLEAVLHEVFHDQAEQIECELRRVSPQWFSGSREGVKPWVQTGPVFPLSLSPSLLDRLRFLLDCRPREQAEGAVSPDAEWLPGDLRDALEELLSVSLVEITDRVRAALDRVASDQEKPLDVSFGGGVERVPLETGALLENVLEELLSQAVIHGIESPQEREAAQKPPRGQIRIFVSLEGGNLLVRVSDDGRGLELEGEPCGQDADSPGQPLQSSQLIQSRQSGLLRVRDALESGPGGSVSVKGGPRGTTVTLTIPWGSRPWRGLLGGRGDFRFVVPSSLVEDLVPLHSSGPSSEVVRDSSGGRFVRYREQLVPLDDPGPDDPPLVLILPVAAPEAESGVLSRDRFLACGLDYAPREVLVFSDGPGTVSIPSIDARDIPVIFPERG